MTTTIAKEDHPLRRLLAAEKDANERILREEKYRIKRLQEAEHTAQEIYETRRTEEEAKFQAEVRTTRGEGDEELRRLLAKTEATKHDQLASFNQSKDVVINLLLHHTTTCGVTLTESEKQAFLAIARKKKDATKTPEDE